MPCYVVSQTKCKGHVISLVYVISINSSTLDKKIKSHDERLRCQAKEEPNNLSQNSAGKHVKCLYI